MRLIGLTVLFIGSPPTMGETLQVVGLVFLVCVVGPFLWDVINGRDRE